MRQDRTAKFIFKTNCNNCHSINKTTKIAPSFQKIRNDYGSDWAIKFVKKTDELIDANDLNALYSIAKFYPVKHTRFPVLDNEIILKIFDYVDSFKYDSAQTKHRRISFESKKKFVDSMTIKHKLS